MVQLQCWLVGGAHPTTAENSVPTLGVMEEENKPKENPGCLCGFFTLYLHAGRGNQVYNLDRAEALVLVEADGCVAQRHIMN